MENSYKDDYKIFRIKFILIIMFLQNSYKVVYSEVSTHPLLSLLFSMINILSILEFIFHKKDNIDGQKGFN